MSEPNKPRPVMTGVIPYLAVHGASEALEFYKRAFGAEELFRMPAEDGKRLMHCNLMINNSHLMMSDDFPEHGYPINPGPSNVTLHLAVDDADKWFKRAVDAGATVQMPLEDQFWGDRYGQVKDPYGHLWSIGSPIKKG